MLRYIIKRSLIAIVTLTLVSVTTFLLFFAGLGSPAKNMCGSKQCTAEQVKRIEKSLELDKPILVQYGRYMQGLVKDRSIGGSNGDAIQCPAPCLGVSFRTNESVMAILGRGLPITLSLGIGSAIFAVLIGAGLGIVSALKRGTWLDKFSIGFALTGASLQIFFLGLLLVSIFVYGLGIMDRPTYTPLADNPLKWFTALILPWITVSFINSAPFARYTRAEMLQVLSEDYIRTARAKGLTMWVVNMRHAFRVVGGSVATIFGLTLGLLLGGLPITESTFGMRGIGKITVDAVQNQDLPIVMAVVLFGAVAVVVTNLVVDVMYAVIDPRIKLS